MPFLEVSIAVFLTDPTSVRVVKKNHNDLHLTNMLSISSFMVSGLRICKSLDQHRDHFINLKLCI